MDGDFWDTLYVQGFYKQFPNLKKKKWSQKIYNKV